MTIGFSGQRNLYKGTEPRGYVRIELEAHDGSRIQLELIADTGCPFDIIVDTATLQAYDRGPAQSVNTTYGLLVGKWLHVSIKDAGLDARVLGYGNDSVVQDTKVASPDFAGLIGLPLLRRMEYGGDADWFWIRPAQAGGTPTQP